MAGCFVSLVVIFGMRLSFQVFFVALIETFNWSRAETAGIFSLAMLIFAATAPMVGRLLDRWGSRRLFSLGAIFCALGLIGSSRATALWHLYLWYGVVTSLGITILGLANYGALIAQWFRRQRGLATGIAFAGTGAGTFIIVPLSERWITAWGWQGAMLGQAALMLLVVLPISALLLHYRPVNLGLQIDGEPAATTPVTTSRPSSGGWTLEAARSGWTFWLILLAGWGSLFSVRLLTVHQVAVAVDAGIDRFVAATVMGGAGVVVIVAFIGWGAISDRLGRIRTFALSSIAMVLAYVALSLVQTPEDTWLLYLYAVLVGLGEGSRSSLVTAVANDTFPGAAAGQIMGYVGMSFGAGSAVGSWLAGRLFDVTGSYQWPLWIGVGVTVISALAMLGVGRLRK